MIYHVTFVCEEAQCFKGKHFHRLQMLNLIHEHHLILFAMFWGSTGSYQHLYVQGCHYNTAKHFSRLKSLFSIKRPLFSYKMICHNWRTFRKLEKAAISLRGHRYEAEEIHPSERMWAIKSNWKVESTGLLERLHVEAEACEL